MKRIAVSVFARLGWAVLALVPVRAEIKVGAWAPIFQGVEFAKGTADRAEPRLQEVRAIRVDLRAPGVELYTTPSNGEAPLETTSETTTEFLRHHQLQVAMNANFYSPCCEPGDKDLVGIAMSKGQVVSAPAAKGLGTPALVITRDNHAHIVTTADGFPTEPYWTAVLERLTA